MKFELITTIIMLLSIPVGYLIAYLCKDELLVGRRWFIILCLTSFIIGSIFFLINSNLIALACFFITIVSSVSFWKSFDKSWTKKRI
jgi:hypothetical protein